VRRVHDAGIKIMQAFVFGLDEDEPSVFRGTLVFVCRNGVEYVTANIIQPYPGTALSPLPASTMWSERPRERPAVRRAVPAGMKVRWADDPAAGRQ